MLRLQRYALDELLHDVPQLVNRETGLLAPLPILLELAGTAEGSHEQTGEDGLLYSQVGIKFFLGTKPFHASARFAGVEDGGGELVRQPHLEGQASL